MIEATPILPVWVAWTGHWITEAGQVAALAMVFVQLCREFVKNRRLEKRIDKLEWKIQHELGANDAARDPD